MSDGLKRRSNEEWSVPQPYPPYAGSWCGRLVRRPNVSWIWCGKHLVRKSGSNLDTETANGDCSCLIEMQPLTPSSPCEQTLSRCMPDSLQKGRLRRRLAWPRDLAPNTVSTQFAKPRLLRQFRSLRRVVRGDHRIVSRQLPLRAVFVRRHSERRQVTPQRFKFKAVVKTHEIIRCDRLTNRYRCRRWFRRV